MEKNITVEKVNAIYENGFKGTCDLRERPCDKCINRALESFSNRLVEEFISKEKSFDARLSELKILEETLKKACFNEKFVNLFIVVVIEQLAEEFHSKLEEKYNNL